MSTASTVTGNTSKAIERHLSSSYQVVLYVAKNLDKIDSAINLMDYFAAFYLGAHTTPPIDTPSGKPLTAGVFYLNVNNNTLYFWTQVNGVFQWTDLNDVVVNVIAKVDAHAATVTTTFTELAEGYDTTFLTYLKDTHTYRNETNLMYQEILLMHAAMLQAYEYVLPLLSHIAEIQAVSEHITEVVQVGANINAVITVSKDIAAILAVPLYMAEIRQAVTTTTTNAQTSTTNAASALASKEAASASEIAANASKVASKASQDAAKMSELAAYSSELSSLANTEASEASKTAAKAAETNAIANSTSSYNYSELARGYANAAEVSKGESIQAASDSSTSASASLSSANAAKVSEDAAKASQIASKASETASKASENASKASELAAKTSETTAIAKATQTAADAVKTGNDVVQSAANAALAEAAKEESLAIAATLTGGIVDKGAWDASTGVFPAKPTRPLPEGGTALVSAFWKVTVAGTAGGISFLVGDDLRFSASTDSFYKVDNTDAVASVQGKTGDVTLSASDVGALATPKGTFAINKVIVAGFTAGTAQYSPYTLGKSVPSNAVFTDTVYIHPTTDGDLHVPATGTTSNGKALVAGATEGSAAWRALVTSDIGGLAAALDAKLDATANAVSATKLQNTVTINGVAFDGSANITINAASPFALTRGTGLTGADYNGAAATTWAVAYGTAAGTACQGNDVRLSDARTPLAHAHTIADTSGLQGVLDSKYSAANKPTPADIGAANQVHFHSGIVYEDTRNINYSPADNRNQFKVTFQALYTNEVGAGGSWYSLMHIPRYSDTSGGSGSQMAFLDNGEIYVRKGLTDTTWTGWNKIYHQGSKPTAIEIGAAPYTHSHAISEVANLQASLNSKQSIDTTMGAIVGARYLTAGQGVLGTKIRLPFTANATKMVCFTVRVYQGYSPYDIQFSGYLYETYNQWYSPRAVMISGNGGITVKMGRDADGVAYVWIAGDHYRGVAVLDIVGGYMQGDWNTGWSITESDDTPNLAFNSYIQPPYSPHNKPTLAELGAQPAGSYAAASHTHDYLPLTGGAITGSLTAKIGAISGFTLTANGTGYSELVYVTSAGNYEWGTGLRCYGGADWRIGTQSIYHTGNKPTAADVGAAPTNHTHSYAPLNGTGTSGSWPISVTGSSASCTGNAATATAATNASNVLSGDSISRNPSNVNPNAVARALRADFVAAGTVGGTGNYGGVLTYSPWDGTTGSTGDSSYQLAFINETGINGSGNAGLRLRKGIDTSWGSWVSLITSANYNSYSPTLTGGGASGTWGISVSGNAATASAASTVAVNESASNAFYDMLWRSGNTVFVASAGKAQLNPATGDMRLGGHVSFAYTSDENLKTSIKEIDNALDKVCSLRASTYVKKSILPDDDGKHTYTPETGFIAQDLEKVIPNLVCTNEQGYKVIRGGGFEIEALLAAAIKEMKMQHDAEIAELKQQIAELKSLI